MHKVFLGIIAVLSILTLYYAYSNNRLIKRLENEKYKNTILESKLDDSNKAIEKLKLDSENYKKTSLIENQRINDKYHRLLNQTKGDVVLKSDLRECNAELVRLKNLIDGFYEIQSGREPVF